MKTKYTDIYEFKDSTLEIWPNYDEMAVEKVLNCFITSGPGLQNNIMCIFLTLSEKCKVSGNVYIRL